MSTHQGFRPRLNELEAQLLKTCLEHPGLPSRDLIKAAGLETRCANGFGTYLLRNMERLGLVYREKEGRNLLVNLTPLGRMVIRLHRKGEID